MSYSLFGEENNFTEVLFSKPETELIKERQETSDPRKSEKFSSSEDIPRNLFILEHLESLLEVVDPRVIRLPAVVSRNSNCSAPLCTRMPPPGINRLPSPELLPPFEVPQPIELMHMPPPPISLWTMANQKNFY